MAFSFVMNQRGHMHIFTPVVLALMYLFMLFIAAFNIRMNFYFHSVNKFVTPGHEIALTIDDSPSGDCTTELLAILKKHDIVASFFCIGEKIEQHGKDFQAIVDGGHFIGNHSYSHRNAWPFWSRKNIQADIRKTQDLIDAVHPNGITAFRPPFGITNPSIAHAIKELKLVSIGWNVRSYDTRFQNPVRITRRMLRKVRPGSIMLFHDYSKVTIEVLDRLIPALKERNYTFITVNEIFRRFNH